jgi:hypothetical protein
LSSDCEQISPVAERRTTIRRSPWFTCVFAAVTLMGWFDGRFLMFLWPEASDWLIIIGVVGTFIATLWLIVCAFLPKPLSAPILLATLVIILAAGLIEDQSGGVVGLGFRVHASPIEQYLATCKKFEFTETGTRHAIGYCESRTSAEGGLPSGQALPTVMHDPTGGFSSPSRSDRRNGSEHLTMPGSMEGERGSEVSVASLVTFISLILRTRIRHDRIAARTMRGSVEL